MENLIVFTLSFVIIIIVYLIIYFIIRKKGVLIKSKEYELLTSKFNLSRTDLDTNKLSLIFALVNSLIISVTGTICTSIDIDYIWQLLIGFALLVALIILVYGIIGKILKIKEGKINNEHTRNRKKVAK